MPKHKIIAIKAQVRDPRRKTLIFKDGSVFGISEDVFISQNLDVGTELDESTLEKIQNEELYSKAYNAALRLLGYRMRSCAEIKRRLLEKKYPINVVEDVITNLLNADYLNDEKFAIAFAHDKIKSKNVGPIVIRNELMTHNIDEDIVQKTLQETYQKYPINKLIRKILHKKKVESGIKVDAKSKKRLIDLLFRKGFNWAEISTVFDEMNLK